MEPGRYLDLAEGEVVRRPIDVHLGFAVAGQSKAHSEIKKKIELSFFSWKYEYVVVCVCESVRERVCVNE